MNAIEQRARELLAEQYRKEVFPNWAEFVEEGISLGAHDAALKVIIAALTPPDSSDQSLLELACTFETCIPFLPPAGQRNIGKAVSQLRHMAMGYVLAPVEPTEEMLDVGYGFEPGYPVNPLLYRAILAARPEVP